MDRLGRDVFVALAAIARADGKIEAAETAALVRAASDEGLSDEDVRAVEHAATTESQADMVALSRLSPNDALFVYAVAYWISRIDGEMSDQEDAVLGELGARMALSDAARMAAEELVDEVAAMPRGDRPDRYDLRRLRDAIGDRLARV